MRGAVSGRWDPVRGMPRFRGRSEHPGTREGADRASRVQPEAGCGQGAHVHGEPEELTMLQDINIDVHHLTRVEGHGNIRVNVTNGVVEHCEWQVPEAPRFFESMVRGRHYTEVARITSRICGICSVGHTLASVKATEAALGIDVTPQTTTLRTLLKHAENFDSHVLHVYVLVAPDLLGAPSVFPLVASHGEVVARALRLKRLAHEWGSLIGGRTTHP
ncbi:hypothetical protein EG835_03290, partial [bacterium]|nr:hypothetical protein [bacterium]